MEKAVQLLSRAINLRPDNAHLYYLRGKRLREMGQWRPAVQDFSACLAINPGYVIAYLPRASCYFYLGLYSTAMLDYHQILNSMVCNHDEVYRLMLLCYLMILKRELHLAGLDLFRRGL